MQTFEGIIYYPPYANIENSEGKDKYNLDIEKCGNDVTLRWNHKDEMQFTKCKYESDKLNCKIDQRPDGKNISDGTPSAYTTLSRKMENGLT